MMDWPNERFVKLYTRDTSDWLLLPWQAQGLFGLLLRKVDRAGRLDLGRKGLRGICAHIGGASEWPNIEPMVKALLDDGCVYIDGTVLVIRNFVEAQNAHQSDAARKRAERERAEAGVPKRDGASQNVTGGHDKGRCRDEMSPSDKTRVEQTRERESDARTPTRGEPPTDAPPPPAETPAAPRPPSAPPAAPARAPVAPAAPPPAAPPPAYSEPPSGEYPTATVATETRPPLPKAPPNPAPGTVDVQDVLAALRAAKVYLTLTNTQIVNLGRVIADLAEPWTHAGLRRFVEHCKGQHTRANAEGERWKPTQESLMGTGEKWTKLLSLYGEAQSCDRCAAKPGTARATPPADVPTVNPRPSRDSPPASVALSLAAAPGPFADRMLARSARG